MRLEWGKSKAWTKEEGDVSHLCLTLGLRPSRLLRKHPLTPLIICGWALGFGMLSLESYVCSLE